VKEELNGDLGIGLVNKGLALVVEDFADDALGDRRWQSYALIYQ
jgi:hypothetical protein